MNSTSTVRAMWASDRCDSGGFVRHRWRISGTTAIVNDRAIEGFVALDDALFSAGYRTVQKQMPVQTFNCRGIGGKTCQEDGTNCSLHAYGLAVDIEPQQNPQSAGDPFSGRLKPEHVAAVEAIRTTSGEQLFRWGGRFKTPDRMHFEINVGPGFAIDSNTVVGVGAAPATGPGVDGMAKRGDRGPDVADLQGRLNDVGALAGFSVDQLTVDGIFGAKTEAAVRSYQTQDGLDATGRANTVTLAKLYARVVS